MPPCALYMGHGCPEYFRDSLTTPHIFHVHLFRSSRRMFLQNLKSVALPVPEIISDLIGRTQKFGQRPRKFEPRWSNDKRSFTTGVNDNKVDLRKLPVLQYIIQAMVVQHFCVKTTKKCSSSNTRISQFVHFAVCTS